MASQFSGGKRHSGVAVASTGKLNPEQKVAASHRDGPMLVLAGPGTGKTATLSARCALLVRSGVSISSVLCLTFTKAAASQLRRRIGSLTGVPERSVEAYTFHGFCGMVMSRSVSNFPPLKIIRESDRAKLVGKIAKEMELDAEELLATIDRFKDALVTPDSEEIRLRSLPSGREQERGLRVAKAYRAFQARLRRDGFMDYGDMIMAVVRELERNRDFAQMLGRRFTHIMVDEYQDTNLSQVRLLDLLSRSHGNLWVVGDDDQSLYSWRSAEVGHILGFERKYGADVVHLNRNYRSSPIILKAASGLISRNKSRLSKKLIPGIEGLSSLPIVLHVAGSVGDEASWVATSVSALVEAGLPANRIAVLSRVSQYLTSVELAFGRSAVPFVNNNSAPFWQRSHVRLALRTVSHLIGFPLIVDRTPVPGWVLDKFAGVRLKGFHQWTARVCSEMAKRPPAGLASDAKEEWRSALMALIDESRSHSTPHDFADAIAAAEDRTADDGVQLMSIHGAKGLEWDVVFLIACEDGVLPHRKAATKEQMEEERRLAFVAETRAKRLLCISYARMRDEKPAAPSPFIEETLSDLESGEAVSSAEFDMRDFSRAA